MFGLTDREWHLAIDILIKLGIGVLLAGLIGWEREQNGRPAGIRTHMLLMMGVVLFCEASKGFYGSEPSRVAAQVVVGVGFLGAGTIMRTGLEVKGLTTAASMWATSAIGMSISLGGAYMFIAIVSTLLALFTLIGIDKFERRFMKHKRPHMLKVETVDEARAIALLDDLTNRQQVAVRSFSMLQTKPTVIMEVEVRGHMNSLVEHCSGLEGIISARWENGL